MDSPEEHVGEWGEQIATRAAEKACNIYSLERPVLIRISHAAVYASGEHIVRVEQQGRPVWSGEALVALTRYVAARDIRTAPPVFDLLPLIVDGLHVTFYRRVVEQVEMPESQKAFLLGKELASMHKFVDADHVRELNMDSISLDFSSATVDRTLRSLKKIEQMGSKALSSDDIRFLLSGVEDLGSCAVNEPDGLNNFDRLKSESFGGNKNEVVVHGDAHLGNVLPVEDGIVLIDFEHTAVAESFFDHIHVLLADCVFAESNLYPFFAEGYGEDFSDLPHMGKWLKIVAVSYLTWTASVGEHSLPHRIEARHRMQWWRDFSAENPLDGSVISDGQLFWTPGF